MDDTTFERFNPGGGPTPDQLKAAAYRQLQAAYKQYLNRDASESELESHLAGRYDNATVQRAVDTIRTSAEAQDASTRMAEQRTQQQQQQSPPQTPQQQQQQQQPPQQPAPFTREDRDKLTWSNIGRLEGFQVGSDYGGDVKARNSVKNTFGRIASRYPATPAGLRQVMQDPEFKRAFPNAKLIDHPKGDKIDFGGVLSDFETGTPVGIVDVGKSFSGADQKDQTSWVWQPESTSNYSYAQTQRQFFPQQTPGGPTNAPGGTSWWQGMPSNYRPADAITPPTGDDAFDQYMKWLESLRQQYRTQPPFR